MLWSSLPSDQLPAKGDRVVYSHQHHLYTVLSRLREPSGQVLLELQPGHWERVECMAWALHVGCVATVLLKPYIDWMQAQIDWQQGLIDDEPQRYQEIQQAIEALKKRMGLVNDVSGWLYDELHVTELQSGWATVLANGKGHPRQLPTVCLAVLRRVVPEQPQQLALGVAA